MYAMKAAEKNCLIFEFFFVNRLEKKCPCFFSIFCAFKVVAALNTLQLAPAPVLLQKT
jgi:hypothetical protein